VSRREQPLPMEVLHVHAMAFVGRSLLIERLCTRNSWVGLLFVQDGFLHKYSPKEEGAATGPLRGCADSVVLQFQILVGLGGTVIVSRKPFPPQLAFLADSLERRQVSLDVHDLAVGLIPLGIVPTRGLELRAPLHWSHFYHPLSLAR
jgi:hypothetical protein